MSTLRSYVEGLGGQLEITAVFPEGATPIRNFADLDARLSIAHQTKEAWKSRLIDAADQFLVAVGEVFQSLDLAITAQKAGADDLQAKVHEARLAYGQAARSAIRVGLLYGTDSSPEQAAQDVLDCTAPGPPATWLDKLRDHVTAGSGMWRVFIERRIRVDAAAGAVRQPRLASPKRGLHAALGMFGRQ